MLPIHKVPSYSSNYWLHTITASTEAAPLWNSAGRLVSFCNDYISGCQPHKLETNWRHACGTWISCFPGERCCWHRKPQGSQPENVSADSSSSHNGNNQPAMCGLGHREYRGYSGNENILSSQPSAMKMFSMLTQPALRTLLHSTPAPLSLTCGVMRAKRLEGNQLKAYMCATGPGTGSQFRATLRGPQLSDPLTDLWQKKKVIISCSGFKINFRKEMEVFGDDQRRR